MAETHKYQLELIEDIKKSLHTIRFKGTKEEMDEVVELLEELNAQLGNITFKYDEA